MSPSESSMPLIAFLLFTHARLQDNACAMSHDSYVGSRKSTIEITKSAEKSGNQREIRRNREISDIAGKTAKSGNLVR